MSETMVSMALPFMQCGQVGTVSSVLAAESNAKRLADIGFVKGAILEMVRPGTPCIVRIDGTLVGLGARHQTNILLDIP